LKANNLKKKRALALILFALLIAAGILIFIFIGKPMNELVQDTSALNQWIEELGWGARLAYIGMVCFQVLVAFVPGEPLELAAGYAFGTIEGTLLCIAGIALGSAVVFALVRRFGVRLVELFFPREKIHSLRIMQNPKRLFNITAILMILPGTPKDLLTYCAGLTEIPFGTWMLISTIGRIPSVITSTWGGSALAEGDYLKAGIIFAATALVCGVGLYFYNRMQNKPGK